VAPKLQLENDPDLANDLIAHFRCAAHQGHGVRGGIDRMAERIPGLFLRFLYVGVTRAATYLGLTCETVLPKRLEPVRPHFTTTSWTDA
jgi:hypothetical protein